ncbi:MAG: hypothetical protein O7C75_13345 [Verrucomicrobia bacterium]|nr:hypothetical protein [Verrucomicrobiota bacterium]
MIQASPIPPFEKGHFEVCVEQILEVVASFYGVDVSSVKSLSQKLDALRARQVSFYLLKELVQLSVQLITDELNIPFNTGYHRWRAVRHRISTDSLFAAEVNNLKDAAKALLVDPLLAKTIPSRIENSISVEALIHELKIHFLPKDRIEHGYIDALLLRHGNNIPHHLIINAEVTNDESE